ncbi:MAG: ImmA/IrrE family metallo-endopeptidase [Clostridium sp.]|uniref:ImmA/IrrE family metallo-endopeptidase n=1 Tax=Clostridium sp. TaxID=1506 RepID=UPI0039EC11E1
MAERKNPFMPFIDDFDQEAEKFLRKYNCAEAIYTPMPIPIWDIATKLMALDIVQTENLSAESNVHGAIAFTKGIIEIYDWLEQEYIGYEVKKGTVFLDADMLNNGRINNTLAHECFHWYKHRAYFVYRCTHEAGVEFGFRCDNKLHQTDNQNSWSDEEKMEWQARTIAPKILMPKKATIKKIDELYKTALNANVSADRFSVTKCVINELASFFQVSKQSAAIRMTELGYHEASEFYHYDEQESQSHQHRRHRHSKAKRYQQKTTPAEAFELYCSNDFLRATINTGSFCYAEGYFVLKDSKYIILDNNKISLTEYAKDHLSECTLDFSTKLVNENERYDHATPLYMMYRIDMQYIKLPTYDSTPQNMEMFNKAKALENVTAEFESDYTRARIVNQTTTQRMWSYIQAAKWNTSIFQDRTLLGPMDYSRVQKPEHIFKIEAYTAMAVGLKLSLTEANSALQLSGMVYSPTIREHYAYMYILTSFHGCSIHECNEVLQTLKVPTLGAHSRDEKTKKPKKQRRLP